MIPTDEMVWQVCAYSREHWLCREDPRCLKCTLEQNEEGNYPACYCEAAEVCQMVLAAAADT